jgi:hypothetical protein
MGHQPQGQDVEFAEALSRRLEAKRKAPRFSGTCRGQTMRDPSFVGQKAEGIALSLSGLAEAFEQRCECARRWRSGRQTRV